MTVQVTVTRPAGSSAGPFDIYTDADGYQDPIMMNVQYDLLKDGIIISDVPESATTIRVQSISGCTNEEEAYITSIPICDSTPVLEQQMWMGCNLDVDTYSDGEPIPRKDDKAEFGNAPYGAWCYYNNDPDNGATYGKLYNWNAVMGIWNEASKTDAGQRKKLAPDGWEIPTLTEFNTLVNYSGGTNKAGNRLKEVGDNHWPVGNSAINLNGFTALPGGRRDGLTDSNINQFGYFWSRTPYSTGVTYAYGLSVDTTNEADIDWSYEKSEGLSVRCISVTTQVYPKCGDVEIGSQTWAGCNLNTDKYQNGDPIFQALNKADWELYALQNVGAWCYPGFSTSKGSAFKKLYNWWAVSDTDNGGIVPPGYHIPTTAEFNALATEVGGIAGATQCGFKLREQGTRYWANEADAALVGAASNLSGFTAFPTGIMLYDGTYNPTDGAQWWTSDPGTTSPNRKTCYLLPRRSYDTGNNSLLFNLAVPVDSGVGVRLIKNSI